jgi:hypothetical protein
MKKHLLILATALISISTFSQIPNYMPANGLVGWWPFNGNANDESGNNLNANVIGANLTSDRFGNANQAYSFDGVDDYFDVGINQMDSFTVSLWIKNNSFSSTGIIWQHKNNCNRGGGFMLMQINGNIRFYTYNCGECSPGGCGNIVDQSNLFTLNLNEWYHILLTKTNLGQIKLYVNSTQVVQFTNTITNLNFGVQPFSIGKWHDVPDLYFTNANKDDIGIWNRALTECEIQDLYHAQLNSASMNISAGTDQSICSGDPVTLNGSGGSSYQWNNNVVDGQAFTPNQSANYVLNGTDSLGCQGTDTVVVTVLENAASTLTQTALDSYTLNGQTYTQSGTYTQTVPAANGCDSTITLNLTLNFTGINELVTGAKKLVKITDLNGKIIPRRKNTLMLFIYEDGTIERVVEMD